MKNFRSIRRAIKRGHLKLRVNKTTGNMDVFRKANNGRAVLYTTIAMPNNG